MNRRSAPFVPDFDSPIDLHRGIHREWVESCAPSDESGISRQFLGTSIASKKITLLFVGILLVLVGFGLRSAHIQLFEGRGFAVLAQAQKRKIESISSRRGIIFDAKGIPLVHNIARFDLELNSAQLPRQKQPRAQAVAEISRLSSLPLSTLEDMVRTHHSIDPLVLIESIPYPEALRMMVDAERIPGLAVVGRYGRMYDRESGLSISHIIGYLGKVSQDDTLRGDGTYRPTDSIGKEGVEFRYESTLRGRDGRKEFEVDAIGAQRRIISEEPAVDGTPITLTIHRDLQKRSEDVLKEWMKKFGTTRGVVIISDASSGKILSLVSLPSYDNNLFAKGISETQYKELIGDQYQPLFSRAIQGEYPSGSTIKPLVGAAALQEGIITPKTIIMSTGGIRISRWFFPDWKAGGHGRTNLSKALAESVNTFFYKIGGGYDAFRGLGIERMADYFYQFGLGAQTGIDLPGEANGFIPSQQWKEQTKGEQWYIGDTYHVAIGQGDILVTPLQVHAYTAYFAQSGTSFVPTLVDHIGGEAPRKPRLLKSALVSQETTHAVREGMRRAVTDGSARRLSLLRVSAAGKTGTAQWSTTKKPHAWFTGWAPYEHPQIVITVLVEEGEEGNKSAIGVAYDILHWYFKKPQQASVDNR